MTAIRETARAKINLTLSVLGRRSDGYHEIESLVTFADLGDVVTLRPGSEPVVTTSGPLAAAITGPNLLDKAFALLRRTEPGLRLGAVTLEKNLPVAAGLGGGSADAAALLRAVRRANPDFAARVAWDAIAVELGADVAVCLAGRPALISGIGAQVEPLVQGLPPMAGVLVNPGLPLETAAVYQALNARPAPSHRPRATAPGPFADIEALVDYIRARGNDLEAAARSLLPIAADLKAALAALPGCLYAGLSGSGPTSFSIFADEGGAARAAATLTAAHPDYWVRSARLDRGRTLNTRG
jgi:4-diphosphocytidyl-2-C-methyl-D-erythritol kinase